MAVPIDLEAKRMAVALQEQREVTEAAIDVAKAEWKKLAVMEQEQRSKELSRLKGN